MTAYSWDAENRLIQITTLNPTANNPAHTSKFTYDGFGRRVEDQEYAGVNLVADRKFIFDIARIAEERDQHNNVVKRLYGNGVQVVSGSNAGNYVYLMDHLGSIREILDASGNVASVADYDLWGNLTQTAGTFQPDFGYAGMFEHYPSGLALTWFRAYSPSTSRWISRDPMNNYRNNENLYDYVANNPASLVDPDGRQWQVLLAVAGAFYAGWQIGQFLNAYSTAQNQCHVNAQAPTNPNDPAADAEQYEQQQKQVAPIGNNLIQKAKNLPGTTMGEQGEPSRM